MKPIRKGARIGRFILLSAWALLAGLAMSGCTPLSGKVRSDTEPAGPVAWRALAESLPGVESVVHYAASAPFLRTGGPGRAASARRVQGAAALPVAELMREVGAPPLSPGDRLRVTVHEDEDFSGLYEVDIDGTLNLPHLAPIEVRGLHVVEAEYLLARALLEVGYYLPAQLQLTVDVQQWAPVQVTVSGAVFAPGMVTVNVRDAEERVQKSIQASGDFPPERLLPAALRSAGGVRPDADLANVLLIRDGRARRVDLAGLFYGGPVHNPPLMSGDSILVPETGQFDDRLVRPTAVTPPGIRVFLSNLTVPANGNADSAIGRDATSLPYGARLLNALLTANCVGGTGMTNSSRYAVLVSRDTRTGKPMVIERSIDALVREPARHDLNPQLLPDDGVACFDSGVTNLRDVARTVGELLIPAALLL